MNTFLFILFLTFVVYPAIGFALVGITRKKIIDCSRYFKGDRYEHQDPNYSTLTKKSTRDSDGIDRELVAYRSRQLIFGWPIFIWTVIVDSQNKKVIDPVDPVVYNRLVERNKELDRELRMHEIQSRPDRDFDTKFDRELHGLPSHVI